MPRRKTPKNHTLTVSGAYASTDECLLFTKSVLAIEDLNTDARKKYLQGMVVCDPLFESGSVTYKKSSIVSPVDLPIRCDLRHNDDAKDPLGAYRLEFKVSVPTTEFENQQTLTGPKTDRAHFFSNYYQVFGPRGTSNKVLAENLKAMVKPLKKAKGSALVAAANDKDVLSAIQKDCERGMTAGAGTSPQFSPKQLLKFWTHTSDKEDGEGASTTYAQLTFSVANLFKEVDQSPEQHEAECALLRNGSELYNFLSANPTLAVNKDALRINVARQGPKPPAWTDIANLISVADPANQANKAVNLVGQLFANPWQTWLNKDRMRILFKVYLNSIDVYAVEKPYMPEATKTLKINLAAADAFDRQRKAEFGDDDDSDDTEVQEVDDDDSDDEPPIEKKRATISEVVEANKRLKMSSDDSETEKELASGKASDLAD